MLIIAVIVMIIYLYLLILSRKEVVDNNTSCILKPFYRIAQYIYKKACLRNIRFFDKPEVRKDLERLNPGASVKQLCTEYYVKKTALSLIICFAGTAVGTLICLNAYNGRALKDDGSIKRGSFGMENQNVKLTSSRTAENIFSIDVEPLLPDNEELEKLYKEFIEALEISMLGDNDAAELVTNELVLTDYIEGYPFFVEWDSSRPDIVSISGYVAQVEEAQEVVLTANVFFADSEWTHKFYISVVPRGLSYEEAEALKLQEALEASEAQSRDRENWTLPSQLDGEAVEWSEVVADNSKTIWAMSILIAAMLFFLSDRDIHAELENRKKKIKQEYPDIVQKFVLYMGAGVNIRGVFGRLAADYEADNNGVGEINPVYKEIVYTCRELQAGVSERVAYENFGKRTGVQEYIRMCTLLQQNLKTGNSAILDRLNEEAQKAMLEKLQNSRRLGEEASTKLLIPMVLLLLVIMIMIIIPAFSSALF